jgi:hypothetical protein
VTFATDADLEAGIAPSNLLRPSRPKWRSIDGLDILSIEPHLIAQTILDNKDDAGEITLSRDVLARMLADFDSIGDEELDVLCMGWPTPIIIDLSVLPCYSSETPLLSWFRLRMTGSLLKPDEKIRLVSVPDFWLQFSATRDVPRGCAKCSQA